MKNYKIFDNIPPSRWVESIPVGNGRMGATMMAGISEEKIYLNEETVWGSKEGETVNPKMPEKLIAVRDLLLEDKPVEAEALANKTMKDCFTRICSYEYAGNLGIRLHESDHARNYKHELDIKRGIGTVEYDVDESHYKREFFASYPDDVIVYRVSSSKEPLKAQIYYERENTINVECKKDTLIAEAETCCGNHKFATFVKVITNGKTKAKNGYLEVTGAKEFVVLISINTEFKKGADYIKTPEFPKYKYTELLKRHVDDFSSIMERAYIDIPGDSFSEAMPITQRKVRCYANAPRDEGFLTLQWQFGRYLLASSSRPGSLPANLQGIWSSGLISEWSGDYHTNINLQENYWGAEIANLSECHLPLFDYMNNYLLESGKRTAKVGYGANGCVVHHLSDIYGFTGPADGLWGMWPHGASWLSFHMWEHYQYTKDINFLKNTAYEFIKQASIFFLDTMVEDKQGRLLFGPSHSPENRYWITDEKGERHRITLALSCAGDTELIGGLLKMYVESSEILSVEDEDVKRARTALTKIPKLQIGKFGQIVEWLEDYEEWEIGHRHASHLFALYPDNAITRKTPELLKAAEVTLDRRVNGPLADGRPSAALTAGHTIACCMGFYARLRKGNDCYNMAKRIAITLASKNLWYTCKTFRDCFQIDANLGYVGTFAEMFIQSHEGVIALIPAIPDAWSKGEYKGLRARGGFEVDAKWEDYSVTEFKVKEGATGECVIEFPPTQKGSEFKDKEGNVYKLKDNLLNLNVNKEIVLTAI